LKEIEDHDLAWIVVDCSNLQKCIEENFPGALRQNVPPPKNQMAPIVDPRTTVIRTGDLRSVYTRDVAHMLWVASLNALRKLSLFRKNTRECQLQEEFVLCNFQLSPDMQQGEQAEIRGARMVDGVCDGLPLALTGEILNQHLGRGEAPVPQIGSVCIPLSNFRYNTFQGTIAREKCHVSSILMACTLLGEAAKVHERYSYKASSRALPASDDTNPVKDTERLLRMLKNNEKCLKVTEEWVDKQRPLLI
jgi:hypothetical protein